MFCQNRRQQSHLDFLSVKHNSIPIAASEFKQMNERKIGFREEGVKSEQLSFWRMGIVQKICKKQR